MANWERRNTWFHQSGSMGWLMRSLLWTTQCGVIVGTTSVAFEFRVGAVVGFVVGSVLLLRQINALIDEHN